MVLRLDGRSGFLSTPSARRATWGRTGRHPSGSISIHALCEEGDQWPVRLRGGGPISIHALCEEGDLFSSVRLFRFM